MRSEEQRWGRKEGREGGRGRRWQEEKVFIRHLPLLSITRHFPLEEKDLTPVVNEVTISANI